MTSGLYRAMTWVDLLNSINGQNSSSADTSTSGLGYVAEADEQTAWADAATGLVVASAPGWDQGIWGAMAWQ